MPAAPAVALALTDSDPEAPLRLIRASSVRARLAKRARIVLFAGDSTSNTRIAVLVRVSRPTVLLWRDRFDEHGNDGLHDEPRAGRPRQVSHERIVTARLGLRNATVARCWREYSVQPRHSETFKFSTDPERVA